MTTYTRAWLVAVVAAVGVAAPIGWAADDAGPAAVLSEAVIVDTDVGTDIDDAFALALVAASSELDLRAATTVGGDAQTRAWMVCRFLSAVDRRDVPVAWGRPPQPDKPITGQYQYRNHPALIYNRMGKPVKQTAVELMYEKLNADPGKVTLLALGPLTNIARLLKEHPDAKPLIKRIVLMGGSIRVGYDGKPAGGAGGGGGAGAVAEANIKADVPAARAVFDAGVPLVVAPLDATVPLKLDAPTRKRLFDAYTLLTMQVQAMHQLWDQGDPVLYDAAAAALAFSEKHFTMQDVHLTVDEQGMTRASAGKANARVATAVDGPAFLKWFVDRVTGFGQRAPLRPLRNFTSVIDPGPMPRRVHAFENYETDIERRWWMSGKAETVLKPDAPPGNRRACRAVLTQDFDDLMGDMKSMYRAVIFNPVPGPPMGPRTRLSFRYWLKGTDELRVQLYSLSNGYHRYLAVKDLPQGQWRHAAVDMTQMRRPDGSGGPLSENERIDDIQFYVDPKAELVIDDVVLYDAPPEGPPEVAPRGTDQTRPFPQRLLFTGWFDTGKQGREWPGDFEIVAHEPPRTWKAAKSIARQPGGEPWIRLSLRGQRELGKRTELRFDYHLKGATTMRIELVNSRTKRQLSRELDALASGKWSRTTLAFTVGDDPQSPGTVDEVRFILPKGAELLLDDLLLYVPGTER